MSRSPEYDLFAEVLPLLGDNPELADEIKKHMAEIDEKEQQDG